MCVDHQALIAVTNCDLPILSSQLCTANLTGIKNNSLIHVAHITTPLYGLTSPISLHWQLLDGQLRPLVIDNPHHTTSPHVCLLTRPWYQHTYSGPQSPPTPPHTTLRADHLIQPAWVNPLNPASHYKLIRRFCRSWRCCGSCRDFRLTTGTLRLADARAQTDNWIGDPPAKTKPATPFPDHCMTKKCPACDNMLNFRPILYINKAHHYPL